jgi:hypothetical protein
VCPVLQSLLISCSQLGALKFERGLPANVTAFFLSVDEEVLAKQLCLIDFAIYRSIKVLPRLGSCVAGI